MAYVEVLWARKMFTWYVGLSIAAGTLLLIAAIDKGLHVSRAVREVPFGIIFAIAGYAACIMTTLIAATLNRDREHIAYLWTRPEPRVRIAMSYMLVDIVTIVIAFFAVAGIAAVVVGNWPHSKLIADPNAGALLVRYLALPLMWYGLVEAATSWNGMKGPAVAGISWAVFWLLLIASGSMLPTPVHVLLSTLNLLNPLAYFLSIHGETVLGVGGHNLIPINFSVQTMLAYAIFVAGCTAAAFAWRRMEA